MRTHKWHKEHCNICGIPYKPGMYLKECPGPQPPSDVAQTAAEKEKYSPNHLSRSGLTERECWEAGAAWAKAQAAGEIAELKKMLGYHKNNHEMWESICVRRNGELTAARADLSKAKRALEKIVGGLSERGPRVIASEVLAALAQVGEEQ